MEEDCDMELDVEKELESFFIRRPQMGNTGFAKDYAETKNIVVRQYIPLLFSDLKKIKLVNPEWKYLFKVFDKELVFSSCIHYGTIVAHLNGNEKYDRFILDDCTECMEVRVLKKNFYKEEAQIIDLEIKALLQSPSSYVKDLAKKLRIILDETVRIIDPAKIRIGCRVFIYGCPSLYMDEVTLKAFSVHIDDNKSRNLEIDFKSHLTKWYLNNYY